MVGRFFSIHLPHPHIQWGLDFLCKRALLLFHLCQSVVPSAPPPHQLCDAWNPSERKILGSVGWHWGKGSRRGGVGGFRVCKSSSPGGCKPLCRVDFLPAGNPAHSLHPPPLTSPADAVRAERTSPSPVLQPCGLKTEPIWGRWIGCCPQPSFSVSRLSELKRSRQVRAAVAPGLSRGPRPEDPLSTFILLAPGSATPTNENKGSAWCSGLEISTGTGWHHRS